MSKYCKTVLGVYVQHFEEIQPLINIENSHIQIPHEINRHNIVNEYIGHWVDELEPMIKKYRR